MPRARRRDVPAAPRRRLLVDENIPFAEEAFAPFGDVLLRPGRDISRDDLLDTGADLLVVRSVTPVRRSLLEGTRVRFVGTATTGDDHIDRAACDDLEVAIAVAGGCNARSVVQWVLAALATCLPVEAGCWARRTLGIVGRGRIGSLVAEAAAALGMPVVVCDPPLQRAGGHDDFLELDALLARADVVTLHVPLTHRDDPDATHHLLDARRLALLRPGALLLNAARGPVVAGDGLRALLASRPDVRAALDVFEHEPWADPRLVARLALATPHIAGYSLEGKINGTLMVRDALRRFLRREVTAPDWRPALPPPASPRVELACAPGEPWESLVARAILHTYPIRDDDARLRAAPPDDPGGAKQLFDHLRKTYPVRREPSAFDVVASPPDAPAVARALRVLAALGFRLAQGAFMH